MKLVAALMGVFVVGLTALAASPQQSGGATTAYPIEAIHVACNKRYSAAQVTRISGLAPGKTATISELDAVITRMAATGLFAKVGYKYAPDASGARLVVTFEIEEPEWKVPVIFDNFVWFSEAQLHAALADDVPTFDGTLPLTDGAQARVVTALQTFLKSQGLDRTVVFMTHSHVRTKMLRFLFKVVDPALRVCAVRLTGVSPAWETRLAPAVAAQIGREYSRASLEGFTIGEVQTTYRERGRLDSTVGEAVATLNDGCDGVSLTVPVTEGDEYKWDRTVWAGNAALPSADLDKLMGVRPGAIAETATLDAGLAAVRSAYGKIGHVQAQVTATARGDRATRLALLELRVVEGPQFHMGTVEFVGLTGNDAADLTRRWNLKPGQVFDMTYADEFRNTQIIPLQQRRRLMARGPIMTADVAARVVNVRFEFRAPSLR